MKFVTDDNKYFDSVAEAKAHERELAYEKEKKEKLKAEKQERAKEVEDAYKHYRDLYAKYVDDYSEDFAYSLWGKLADWF